MSGHPGRKSVGSIAAAVIALIGGTNGMASGACAPPPQAVLYSTRVNIVGRTPVDIHVPVPASTEILVTASIAGIDVRVERVGAGSGDEEEYSDNPMRRWGPRRMILDTASRTEVDFRILGKEQSNTHGTVRLDVAPLTAVNDGACKAAYRSMAAGDRHSAQALRALENKSIASKVDVKSEYRQAVENYRNAAIALSAVTPDPVLAQAHLSAAAASYQNLQNWQDAADEAASAHTAFSSVRDRYGVLRATAMQAAADMELALALKSTSPRERANEINQRLTAVRQTFVDLARTHERRHEPFDQALALNNAGLAEYYAGHFDQAIQTYQRVLPLYTHLNERSREAQVLQNIALVEFELGRFTLAKQDFSRALELVEPDPGSPLRGEMLNNQALGEWASGDLDAALKHHSEALSILTGLQLEREVARSLHGIGTVYYAAGDKVQALDYFTRALALRDPVRDPRGRMASLRAKASALSDLHRLPEALEARREALALAVAPSTRVRIQTQLAEDLQASGQLPEARSTADSALREVGSGRSAQALAFLTRAQLHYDDGELADAEHDADQALQLLKGSEAPTDQFRGWVLIAQIAQARHDMAQAQLFVDRALHLAEEVRLRSANPELRAGVWQSLQPVFDLKIELLTATPIPGAGTDFSTHSALALQTLATAELSRARSLADYQRLHDSATSQGDPTARRLSELYREIADRRFELETRRDRLGDDDPRIRTIQADITALLREIDSEHKISRNRDLHVTPRVVQDALQKIMARIPSDTAVIEYWLGTSRAWAWIVTNQGVRMIPLGSSGRLDQAARSYQTALRNFTSVPQEQRAHLETDLAALILQPLPADVLKHPTLIIIPDGALHYIPFAALRTQAGSEQRPLIADHVVVMAPSLESADWKMGGHRSPTRVLVVSDPVYTRTDARFTQNGQPGPPDRADQASRPRLRSPSQSGDFERLPATAVEARAIASQFNTSDVDSLSGFEATRDSLLKRDLSQYRIIHIAAHAVTEADAPQLSALVMSLRDSQGAPIPGEVFAGELLLKSINTEVLVLSACDTALGRETAGEGLLGLRYAAHAAGASSVMASLWQVPDRSAAELMTAFYSRYIAMHASPAEALAAAMRDRWRKNEDPSLWSAFEISSIGSAALFSSTQHHTGESR